MSAGGPEHRPVDVWLDDPLATGEWRLQRRARLRPGPDGTSSTSPTWLPLRRRARRSISGEAAVPADLKHVLGGQSWRSISTLLSRIQGHRLVLDQILADWLDEGWIEVEERASGKPERWTVERIRLSPAGAEVLYQRPQRQHEQQRQTAQALLLAKMAGWRNDADRALTVWQGNERLLAVANRLASIAAEQEEALAAGEWRPVPDLGRAQRAGDAPHRRWIASLRGILAHLASGKWQYERTLAAVWLGDSKELRQEGRAIAEYLGLQSLNDIGIVAHTPVVLSWGDFRAVCNGYQVDGRAGIPFVALAAETIRGAHEWSVVREAIFVIENQTAFETALRPPLFDAHALYLFSGGHAGLAERELLKAWLDAAPAVPWHVWTDWDPGGIRIQMDWARWAEDHSLPQPRPWLWERQWLERWSLHGRPLSDDQQHLLSRLTHPLAERLQDSGKWIEQEAVLWELGQMGQTLLGLPVEADTPDVNQGSVRDSQNW